MTTTMNHFIPAPKHFDVIIIGAGHAGCEAALACAKLNLVTLLMTSNADRIGHLSCNPAVGGLGKGHMVREIDALGGSMAKWTDAAAIQVRTLNESKGPAVRATRAQVDREAYMAAVKADVWKQENLFVREEMADALLTSNGVIKGVRTLLQQEFYADAVLITAGTFVRGHIHIGNKTHSGGRLGDAPSIAIAKSLEELNFTLRRFMTCTTPRLHSKTIDFSQMEIQHGDTPPPLLSKYSSPKKLPQLPCYLTWTNAKTHDIIQKALTQSPMYSGAIPGTGPRYCPSIEDKIARFPEKLRHQVFVEPEGINSTEYYPNGLPTGLPLEVQQAVIASIPGLEHAHIVRPGYAIEYDVIDSTTLKHTLESKDVKNLWFAGQINGTSGYEEAAAQGLWAALNIAAAKHGTAPFVPLRNQSYIGVLIDDLVTKGTNEPYRMFTSRAEHRLLLRESNADLRLTAIGREIGLVDDELWEKFCAHKSSLDTLIAELELLRIAPNQTMREFFSQHNEPVPTNAIPAGELLRRPQMTIQFLTELFPHLAEYAPDVCAEAETHFRYAGYITRQEELAQRHNSYENVVLPETINYKVIDGLDLEAQEKLTKHRPENLGQASRIPGVSPSALASIEIYLKKNSK